MQIIPSDWSYPSLLIVPCGNPKIPPGKRPGFALERSTIESSLLRLKERTSLMVPCRTAANLPWTASPVGLLTLPTPVVHPSYPSVGCLALWTAPVPSGHGCWPLTKPLSTTWSGSSVPDSSSMLDLTFAGASPSGALPVFPLLSCLWCVCMDPKWPFLRPALSSFWRRCFENVGAFHHAATLPQYLCLLLFQMPYQLVMLLCGNCTLLDTPRAALVECHGLCERSSRFIHVLIPVITWSCLLLFPYLVVTLDSCVIL